MAGRHFFPHGALMVLIALLSAGCSDSTSPLVPTGVTVSGYTGPLSYQGQTVALSAQVSDQNGESMVDAQVQWSSTDTSVGTVDHTGTVTAVGPGNTTIRADAGGAQASIQVRVDLEPASNEIVSGDAQVGVVGEPLEGLLVVEVRDSGSTPIPDAEVSFVVTQGGGSVAPASISTDASGEASTVWTLGTEADAPQRVEARSGTQSVVFEATAHPGSPATLEILLDAEPEGYAGEPMDDPLEVQVSDGFGNGVPDVEVRWELLEGAGEIAPHASVSDSLGIARADWTLSPQPGEDRVRVSAEELPPLDVAVAVLPNAVIEGSVSLAGAFLGPMAGGGIIDGASGHPESFGSSATPGSASRAGGPAQEKTEDFVEGELLVTYSRDPLGPAAAPAALLRDPAATAEVHDALRSMAAESPAAERFQMLGASPALATVRVRVREGEDIEEVAEALRQDPRVADVSRNPIVRGIEPPTTGSGEAPAFQERLAPSRTLGTAGVNVSSPWAPSNDGLWPWQAWHYDMLDVHQAWKVTRGDPEIVVAVVDDGIRLDHPEFHGQTVPGYSFIDSDPIPLCSGVWVSADGHGNGPGPDPNTPIRYQWNSSLQCASGTVEVGGHGLHVAGTIAAAADNGYAGAGVAPDVRILPVRVLDIIGRGNMYAIAQGIVFAAGLPVDDGTGQTVQAQVPARIINLSLGGYGSAPIEQQAVQAAHAAGALLVAAAGNDATTQPMYPAAFPEVMAVSALDPYRNLASYSNSGSHIEVAGPGGARYMGFDHGVCSTAWNFSDDRPSFNCLQGTSMAAPHVSAVAALIWSTNPGMTNQEVRQRLRDTALPLGSGQPNSLYGHGLVHARAAVNRGWPLPGHMWVRLQDESGAVVATERMGSGGSFRFDRLDNGTYHVFSGMDEFGDGHLGVPPRVWGAFGGSASPISITVDGQATHVATHEVGLPLASDSNGSPQSADLLPVGGYLHAILNPGSAVQHYRITIPTSGQYVFETRGWYGACGFPLAADTHLELLNEGGSVIGQNQDIDSDAFLRCSRIEQSLNPGTYLLRVQSADGQPGYYRILARELN